MGEFILFVAIFIGIMAVAALVFGGWFIVMIFRGVAGFLGLRSTPAEPRGFRRPSGAVQLPPLGANQRLCPYELCKAPNDMPAKFCRRCGRELGAPHRVNVRRAAVW